ncbi:MAG: TonB-dependent receptor [Alphaproteobacteria bacterium]|nr:TonB-dependent receptor [Alphaproteobacteria bacterium]
MPFRPSIALVLLALAGVATPAYAQSIADEADTLFRMGTDAYDKFDYETALIHFMQSNRLSPNAITAGNVGHTYVSMQKYPEAYRWYALASSLADGKDESILDAMDSIKKNVVLVELASNPEGATVYLDRKSLGAVATTPATIALPAGEYTFIMEREGHQDFTSEKVSMRKLGQKVDVKGELERITGLLSVSGQDGAEVRLGAEDADVLCVTPCETPVPIGQQIVYFRKEGFRSQPALLTVEADKTASVPVNLIQVTGSVAVSATERGAAVEIDGVRVGYTPMVAQAVPAGSRKLRVALRGFEPVEQTIEVPPDGQLSLERVELIPISEVTAVSRRAESVAQAPSSVTLISRDELQAFRYPTIYEALRGVRGISLTYDSIYGSAAVRGLGQANDFGNRLLILSDGATLNDPILYQSFISYDGRVDLGGIERIEIVRGPGSVLYGTGAVSGVVNLIGEGIDAPETAELTVGTFDNHVYRARAAAHYNLTDKIGFRASVSAAGSQGRSETLNPRGPDNDLTVKGFDRFKGATTTGRLWLGDATFQWYHAYRTINIPTGVYDTDLNVPNDNYWVDNRTMAELRYEPKLSEKVRLLTRAYFNRYQYDGFLPYGDFTSVEKYVVLSGGAEARVIAEPADIFRIQAGAVIDASPRLTLDGEDRYEDGTAESYLEESQPYQIAAGYAVIDFIPIPEIRITAGARADYWSTFGGLALSPRFAMVLEPRDGDVIKLLAGRAFRAPSTYELYYNIPGVQLRPDTQGIDIEPETVWSTELEYSHAFDSVWTGLISGHYSVANKLIETIEAPLEPEAVTYGNSAEAVRIVGADVELRREFRGGWMLSGFYSALDSRYADSNQLVPNVPTHNAGGKFIMPIAGPVARVAYRANLEAPRRIDLVNDNKTGWAIVSDLVLSGTAPDQGFDYAVGVYNLFNQSYSQPLSDTFPFRTMPQQGRSLMAEVTLRL